MIQYRVLSSWPCSMTNEGTGDVDIPEMKTWTISTYSWPCLVKWYIRQKEKPEDCMVQSVTVLWQVKENFFPLIQEDSSLLNRTFEAEVKRQVSILSFNVNDSIV